jgi:hypothetical protein
MAFSRRDLFWYCAGIASVLAVWLLLHALNGAQMDAAPVAQAASDAAPAQIPSSDSAPDTPGNTSQKAGTMDEVLRRLEARMATQGGSDSDWELLAQTYDFVGRSADAKLARSHQLPPSSTALTASSTPASAPGALSAAAGISGSIDVAAALKSKVPAGLTLFIVAKSVDSPGPPVAIIRTTTGHWPLSFSLDDSNAMLPGRNLSSAARVTIEARVSRSGMATPQSGDFQSSVAPIDPHAQSVHVVIDHIIG